MTAEVLQFKQKPVKGLAPKASDEPRLYCKTCCDDRFYIHEGGSVSCYHCKAHILNLKAILVR